MPELAEVETIRRSLAKKIIKLKVESVRVIRRDLRWAIPNSFEDNLTGSTIQNVRRRSKYLFIDTEKGTALIHLGMSGSLRFTEAKDPLKKHDHVEIKLSSKIDAKKATHTTLRYHDPRRFGSIDWSTNPEKHKRIINIGPEPLERFWNYKHLLEKAKSRRIPIKNLLLNGHIVAGVGNIYANEALFLARVSPLKPSFEITEEEAKSIVKFTKKILKKSIELGGTTLRDYINTDGSKGEFVKILKVYDREGEPCKVCETDISRVVTSGRSTFYCKNCQNVKLPDYFQE